MKISLPQSSQQEFLREAMDQLNMTHDEFASRLSVARRTLDRWLLPSESADARALPETGRAYIEEVLQRNKKET